MYSLDENIVEKYFAGECSEAEMEQILQWLKASEENRKEWLKLRLVSARSNFIRFSEPEEVERSYKKLRKENFARKMMEERVTRKIAMRFLRYAASILLLIGLSYASYRFVSHHKHPEMTIVAVGGDEQTKQIMLSDSSQVWLSAGSRIEYPRRFGKNDRTVTIEGKAYFEVAKDAERPFYVNTDVYAVKVLGTAFEVNAPKYSQTSDVTLLEGEVEIIDMNRKTLCTLQPGQQFEIDRISNDFRLNNVDAKMYTSWHEGKLEFDGLTFAQIAKALERHYDVIIILDDGIAANEVKLVGSLSLQKNILQMMETIELVIPVVYQVQANKVVHIKSK